MAHHAPPGFWKYYHDLPTEVRELADRCFKQLKEDPFHNSLEFKKIGKMWSVRVGIHYRALATPNGNDFIWFWIGTREKFDQIVYSHK